MARVSSRNRILGPQASQSPAVSDLSGASPADQQQCVCVRLGQRERNEQHPGKALAQSLPCGPGSGSHVSATVGRETGGTVAQTGGHAMRGGGGRPTWRGNGQFLRLRHVVRFWWALVARRGAGDDTHGALSSSASGPSTVVLADTHRTLFDSLSVFDSPRFHL